MPTVPLEPVHRFHSYCARFPSEIVEAALEQYTAPGDSIFDPFCGSGTTLVASLAHKRRVIGSDIDILAGMLSEVKCTPYSQENYTIWRRDFEEQLTSAFAEIARAWQPGFIPRPGTLWSLGSLSLRVPLLPELNYWFPPQLIAALTAIAEIAHSYQDPHYERVVLVSLSASIIAKWPKTLSYAMDIDHTRPHRRIQRFTLEQIRQTYLQRLDRTLACLGMLHTIYHEAKVLDVSSDSSRVVYPHDARDLLPVIQEESQALVVTSPPYFNAVDYPRAHRMAVCWMNGYAPTDLASRRRYIGLRYASDFSAPTWLLAHPRVRCLFPPVIFEHESLEKRLCAFFADLEAVLRQIWRVLRPGGHAVFVIANNVIKGQRLASHAILSALAQSLGFNEIDTNPREIATYRRRFPIGPFGFDGPMTHEYLVVLRKPFRAPRKNVHVRAQ